MSTGLPRRKQLKRVCGRGGTRRNEAWNKAGRGLFKGNALKNAASRLWEKPMRTVEATQHRHLRWKNACTRSNGSRGSTHLIESLDGALRTP